MRFLIDEDVPPAVAELLQRRGHDVVRVADALGMGTADAAVARYADVERRIVVTFNLRHFNRLILRAPQEGGARSYPHAGLMAFRCQHPDAEARLNAFIVTIEHEHEFLGSQTGDVRIIVQITDTCLKIQR